VTLALNIIKLDEGFISKPYYCTERYPTIGWGRVVGKKNEPLPDVSTTKEKELPWVEDRIKQIVFSLSQKFPLAWSKCNDVRKAVLISSAYQVGTTGITLFKKMWKAIEVSDWEEASKQILDSLAARQTPARWKRNSSMMESGILDNYYK
jgi:lysozyme